jgi:hypothetical protein
MNDVGALAYGTHVEMVTKPNKRRRYYLVSVTEFNGEQEYEHNFLMWVGVKADPQSAARKLCRRWYDGEYDGPDDIAGPDHFDFMMGKIGLTLDSVKEIPETHYRFLLEHGYNHEL